LVSSLILTNSTFQKALVDATVINYAKMAPLPLKIWSLKEDSIVTPNNTRKFIDEGIGNKFIESYWFDNDLFKVCDLIPQKENIIVGVGVDHVRAEVLANIFAL
jgi:hypothetical protein